MLKKLIEELCPHGVEYWSLDKIGNFYNGLTGKSKNDFVDGNRKFITYKNVFDNPSVDITHEDYVKIKNGERQNTVKYGDILFTGSSETPEECAISSVMTTETDEPFYLNSFTIGYRLFDISILLPDFSKHLFRSANMRIQLNRTANGVTRYNVSKPRLGKVLIPVPPIPIQKEIVWILDKFTLLKAELEAELEARTVQYHYYRNALLDLSISKHARRTRLIDSLIEETCKNEVPFYPLNQLFNIRNGYTPSKSNRMFWENGTIPWFRMEDIRENGGILTDSIQKITPEAVRGKLFPKDSIIITTLATIGDHALILTDYLANQQFTCLWRKEEWKAHLDPYFIYYYCFKLGDWCRNNTNVSGFASVNMDGFKRYMFPVPPMQIQKTIVNILDRFETLVQDLQDGLPGEIALRQKQYEYYRDQLLSFKALKSEEKAEKTEPAIISRSSYDTI